MNENLKHVLYLDIKTPIEYWHKYWQYLVHELKDQNSHEILLRTPRLVIEDILEELSHEEIWIEDNTKLFETELSDWDKKDIAFNSLFQNEVTLIIQHLQSKDQRPIIIQMCQTMLDTMNQGKYFDELLIQLIKVVTENEGISYEVKKTINKLTISLISEFVAKGFAIEDLQDMTTEIPGVVFIQGKVARAPDECCSLKRKDYPSQEDYYDAIYNAVDKRSNKDVINNLRDYYYQKPKDCYVLFRIEGLKGNSEFRIGDIDFYCPLSKRYIHETDEYTQIESGECAYVNTSVRAVGMSYKNLINVAKGKLMTAIQLLSAQYAPEYPITISNTNVTVVDKYGTVRHIFNFNIFSDKKEKLTLEEKMKFRESIDISKCLNLKDVDTNFSKLNTHHDNTAKKLKASLHWLNKSENTKNDEDRFLFAWIALEELIELNSKTKACLVDTTNTKPNIRNTTQQVIRIVMGMHEYYQLRKRLFYKLYSAIHYGNNYYEIPKNVVDKCELGETIGNKHDLNKFVDNLDSLDNTINDEIMKTKIHEVRLFYSGGKKAFEKKCKELDNITTLLYRIRNLEVHHGNCSHLIKYYVPYMTYFSSNVFYFILTEYVKKDISIDEMLINRKAKYEEFILTLNNKKS